MSAAALVLAAGEGTRMKSDLPKVAHPVLGVPMISLVLRAAREAGVERIVVVTGHKSDVVEALIPGESCVLQERQLGTGHAVMCGLEAIPAGTGSLLVLSGDSPLITAETLRRLVETREESGAAVSVLTTRLPDPSGYGRIVRDESGALAAIVEDKDLAPEQRGIDEVNTGTYCFDADALRRHLDKLTSENAQGEYYLTDMIGHLRYEGLPVVDVATDDPTETLGVNSRVQLAEAAKVLQRRINRRHMLAGVTMTDPDLVWIAPSVSLGRDVVLEPMTFLMGETSVADGATFQRSDTSRASASRSSGGGVPPTSPYRAWNSDPASVTGEANAAKSASPACQPFGTRRTSSTSPAAPTTGVGWIARPLVSL
jgi:bifunctional UDP-N-acetylglucosamine pyrophosphorylase/glucosamine-1-phosphate N-acetyltransferase